jgi:hypothetical protein
MERHVEIPISDIVDEFAQRIMNHYGVKRSDVKCISAIEYITFEIPGLNDELCNEVMSANVGEHGEVVDGCGGTGGGCICLLPRGHGNRHICEKCGEEWEINDNQK